MWPFKYPYTNFHELNLDWILNKVRELSDYVYTLNVPEEVKKEIAKMAADGSLEAILQFFAKSMFVFDNVDDMLNYNLEANSFAMCSKYYANGDFVGNIYFISDVKDDKYFNLRMNNNNFALLLNGETIDQFGAVGDGNTDDTQSFVNCYNFSKKVIFGAKTYLINGATVADDRAIIRGTTNTTVITTAPILLTGQNQTIENITFYNRKSDSILKITGHYINIYNCKFFGEQGTETGVIVENATSIAFAGCLTYNLYTGINIAKQCLNLSFSDCSLFSKQYSVFVNGLPRSEGVSFVGCKFLEGKTQVEFTNDALSYSFSNCIFDQFTDNGIDAQGFKHSISECWFGSLGNGKIGYGVNIKETCSNIIITGCTFNGLCYGVRLSSSKKINISNNVFDDCRWACDATTTEQIILSGNNATSVTDAFYTADSTENSLIVNNIYSKVLLSGNATVANNIVITE